MSAIYSPPPRTRPARSVRAPARNRRPREGVSQGAAPGRKRSWVVIFIVVSLLAHLFAVIGIVLMNQFLPKPELKALPEPLPSTTLSLETPPPPPPAPPPPKKIFMMTQPDAAAVHQEQQIESANDTRLRSESTQARAPDSIMPDVTAKLEHAANLHQMPNAPSTTPPRAAPNGAKASQPQPKAAVSAQPTPQTTPNPAEAQQPTPNPQPKAKETKPTPAVKPTPQVAQQQLDPNGLPVLPPINAPTMAPATQREEESAPAASIPEIAQSVHGALGTHGDNSPAAMRTELGAYKAKFYAAVGSRWYPKVDKYFQALPVGTVDIQYTIHSDGTIDTKVIGGDNSTLQTLLSISLNSIRETAPFDPFTPAMIKEVGDSYTDDFTFSIYGQ